MGVVRYKGYGKVVCVGCRKEFELSEIEKINEHFKKAHGRTLDKREGLDFRELPYEFRKLKGWATKVLETKKLLDWLWKHTNSEYQYYYIIEILEFLANIENELCEWYNF